MKIVKVMNNSLLIVKDKNNDEVIVMGKGIGFKMKAGDEVDESKVEKTFVPKDENLTKEYTRLIEETPSEYIEIVNHIIDYSKEMLDRALSEQLFFTLIDHVSYSVSRLENNIVLQNRLSWEVKRFYSKEFSVGVYSVNYINEKLNVNLPEEEAANIAFHLVNAQIEYGDMEKTLDTVKILKDIFNIVQYNFNIIIDKDSINYSRFLTHLQFFVQRLLDDRLNISKDSFILQQVKNQYPKEYRCAELIGDYVKNTLDKDINNEELLYLTMHIIRVTER